MPPSTISRIVPSACPASRKGNRLGVAVAVLVARASCAPRFLHAIRG